MNPIVKPKKSLGQHFLNDKNIAEKVANSIPSNDLPLLEVGPGMGMLTGFLLQRSNPLKVIEIDGESVDYLKNHLHELDHGQIIHADFLRTDLNSVFDNPFGIVGNFPYNISSQILFRMIENRPLVPMLCGMFQKEVAQRIAAPHGNKQYGILSVLLQTWFEVKFLFPVSEHVFTPPPAVQSAVVLITLKSEQPEISHPDRYIRLVKTAFNQRRKMLRNALSAMIGHEFSSSFLTLRAERLSIDDFITLYHEIELDHQR